MDRQEVASVSMTMMFQISLQPNRHGIRVRQSLLMLVLERRGDSFKKTSLDEALTNEIIQNGMSGNAAWSQ